MKSFHFLYNLLSVVDKCWFDFYRKTIMSISTSYSVFEKCFQKMNM